MLARLGLQRPATISELSCGAAFAHSLVEATMTRMFVPVRRIAALSVAIALFTSPIAAAQTPMPCFCRRRTGGRHRSQSRRLCAPRQGDAARCGVCVRGEDVERYESPAASERSPRTADGNGPLGRGVSRAGTLSKREPRAQGPGRSRRRWRSRHGVRRLGPLGRRRSRQTFWTV